MTKIIPYLNGSKISLKHNNIESLKIFNNSHKVVFGNIICSSTSIELDEQSTTTFTVKLDKEPSDAQIVELSINNNWCVVDKNELFFDKNNYSQEQTVTITSNEVEASMYSAITLSSFNVEDVEINVNIRNIKVPDLNEKQPVTDGLVCWLESNNVEYGSDVWLDKSNSGNNCMPVNNAIVTEEGMIKLFDGEQLKISTANIPNGTKTYEYHYYTINEKYYNSLFYCGEETCFKLQTANQLGIWQLSSGSSVQKIQINNLPNLVDGVITLVVSNIGIKVYKDGVLIGNKDVDTSSFIDFNGNLYINKEVSGVNRDMWAKYIVSFKVYDRELTAMEIEENYKYEQWLLTQLGTSIPVITENYDVFIVAGQSNAVGYGTPKLDTDTFDPSIVYQYKQNNTIEAVSSYPLDYIECLSDTIGFQHTFVNKYIQNGHLKEGRKILLVPCAAPGTSFISGRWQENGDLQNTLLRRIGEVVNMSNNNYSTDIKAVLWHQGESDVIENNTPSNYKVQLSNLINNVRATTNKNTPFILGEWQKDWHNSTKTKADEMLNVIKEIVNEIPNTSLVSSQDLTGDIIHGYIHFSAEAQRIFGERYYESYLNLINVQPTQPSSDVISYSLRRNNDYNTNQISTFYDDNGNNPITVTNMTFTEGNVEGYSGWTERGLQISNKNTVNMDYISAKTVEVNINTLNWQIKRYAFVLGVILETGEEYIIRGYSWNKPSISVYPKDDELTQVDSNSLSSTAFEDGKDVYHSLVFVFSEDGYSTYVDGVYGSIAVTKTSLKNVVGVKLYSSETNYSAMPYESVVFYKDTLSSEEISSNYQNFIKRINTTGYENKPISNISTFNTVADMVVENLAENSIVTTRGYSSLNDNGGATYKIVSYDTFFEELPEDCKKVQINGEVKTTVDNFGNHQLKNGLVAKIISENNVYTPEQWGAVGDGITSDTEAFICMLALIKTGTINFKDGAIYMIASRSDNECSQYTDNRYLKSMIGRFSGGCHRPLIANCKNLVLDGNPSDDGNKATMKIPDNDFGFGMGMLCLGKVIEGLEIKNIIFDSNGFTVQSISNKGVENKISNHTIVYDFGDDVSKSVLNDLNIHHCKFLANGTMVDTSDQGGDHVLIINPTVSNRVWIEDNEFYDWGRWVYSVDLGGNGERLYDYKFNRNICIQTENNYITRGTEKLARGLGWIDFEARKCFTNLEVSGNEVVGFIGFAMNGNGKVLENFTFSNNNITKRELYAVRSAYPYFVNFYSVACAKNTVIENNYFDVPHSIMPSRYAIDGLIYRNNRTPQTALDLHGLHGNIIIDNNKRGGGGAIIRVDVNMYLPDYVNAEDRFCNFEFTNNEGGLVGLNNAIGGVLFKPEAAEDYKNMTFKIEGNKMVEVNITVLAKEPFEFDTSQVIGDVAYGYAVRGATFVGTTSFDAINMPIKGCGIYNEGDLMVENIQMTRMTLTPPFYTDLLGDGKTYNVYCSKTGYFPEMYRDTMLTYGQNITYGKGYFTEDNFYIAQNGGTTPTDGPLPTHTSGSAAFGDVNLLWFASVGRIRVEEVS